MSDNRKYYYLKLKENYFDDDSIVLLESMQDGVLYSNILLKLYLKSLKHGGRLQLDEDMPMQPPSAARKPELPPASRQQRQQTPLRRKQKRRCRRSSCSIKLCGLVLVWVSCW